MNGISSASGHPVLGACPRDAELRRFDQGTLPEDEAERLSDHVATCERCSTLLAGQPLEDTRLMARILTPGDSLLAEREYQVARHALLDRPERISLGQLEGVESTLFPVGWRRDGGQPTEIGAYRLRHELGRGAMGIVYRARHVNLKRDAAIKILHPQLTTDREIVQRFYREMEAIGQLRDPHIVQAHDAGESDDVHFLAMEYVDGADVGRLCAQVGRLSVADACEVVYQAALGLETARRRHMVHRDIKPSNLMVARNGQVKILDFGLASFRQEGVRQEGFGQEGFDHSLNHDAVGTVDYMAPEQWQGSPHIDIRADIYSLGCTLYKLLVGHPPFHTSPDDGVSKMQAHLYQPVPGLREIRREVPRELESLVARMLAKKPQARMAAPKEIAEALQPHRRGSDLAALVEKCVPPRTGDPADLQETWPDEGSTTFRRRKRHQRIGWMVATTSFLLMVAAAIMIRWTDDGGMVVTVNHAGATIQVGSLSITTKDAGEPVTIQLDPGSHQVTVTKDGFAPHQETVDVGRGGRKEVSITLEPQPGVGEGVKVLAGHKGGLEAVDISADGKWILTGATDRTARLWDAETGEERMRFVGHEDAVLDVVFTPDGRRAVTAGKDRTARLWDVETGKELNRFSPHRDAVCCVAVSEDGDRLLTGSVDAQVRLWDLNSGELLEVLGGHRSWVRGVAFLPGSRQAVSCSNDRIVILWDLDTGRMQRVMQGHTQPVCSISAASDGHHVVTGGDDTTVCLWNLDTEQPLTVMRSHVAPVRSVRFVPGTNFVVSCSNDRDVRLWNPFRGECVAELSGHDGDVTDVAVDVSSGRLVSASADRTARVFALPPLPRNPSPEDFVRKPPEPPIGGDVPSIPPIHQWSAGKNAVRAVSVTPNGKQIATAGSEDGRVRIWNTETRELVRELAEPGAEILCLRFSPDGRWLAAAGKDQQIYLWDMWVDSPARTLAGHTGWVSSLAFSDTGDQILSGAFDATMRLWDVKNGQPLGTIPGHIEWIRAVAFGNPQTGNLAISGGNAGCVRLWKPGQGPAGRALRMHALDPPYQTGQIASIAVTADGGLVAVAGWNRPLQVWDTVQGKRVSQFGDPNLTTYDLEWYGDDRRLMTACADGSVRLWDRRDGRELKRYVGHTDAVRSLSMSTDMQVVVTAGEDGSICLWPPQ